KTSTGNALFTGSLLRVAIARNGERLDEFIVLLVRLVLVGFKIGGNGPFCNSLGGFFGEISLAEGEDEFMDAAGFQKTQRSSRNFSQGSGVKLLAFPCPDEEQAGGLQACRRMDEGQFERLPGGFAALGQPAEQTAGEPIELSDAALNGVALLK